MNLRLLRRAVQCGMLALLFAIPFLNRSGFSLLSGSLYSMAIGPLWLTDPAIGLQTMITTRRVDLTLLASLLLPLLVALLGGRVFCGWLCPQNTLSELVDRLPGRRLCSPPATVWPRYAVLVLLLLAIAGVGLPLFSLLSAPGIISLQVAKLVYEHRVGVELALIGGIVLLELLVMRRAWCNFLCPMGSLLGLFRIRRTLKVVFSVSDGRFCSQCRACSRSCQLGLDPVAGPLYPQCHNCGACVDACPIPKDKKPLIFRW